MKLLKLPFGMGRVVLLCAIWFASSACGREFSVLWGREGEEWHPRSRLPDFSFAGYRRGEEPLPEVKQALNVRDFGARGDGEHDDHRAFVEAIDACEGGAVYVPPGRYLVGRPIVIEKSGVVLRGAGPDQTVLYFPKSIEDYAVTVRGSLGSRELAAVTAGATRGDRSLAVSTTAGLAPGRLVEIVMSLSGRHHPDAARELTEYLFAGDVGGTRNFSAGGASQVVGLLAVGEGRIVFDRPLRFDVRTSWQPRIMRFEPSVSEVGIEDLGLDFEPHPPLRRYPRQGVRFASVADCWMYNVHVFNNPHYGIALAGSVFCTIADVVFDSNVDPAVGGRYGFLVGGGRDNLITRFDFRNESWFYEIVLGMSHTPQRSSMGNVFAGGKGADLALDHHMHCNYENLFTDIRIGTGRGRGGMWRSGGSTGTSKNSAARGTFWNISAESPQQRPGPLFAPESINCVAVVTEQPDVRSPHPRGTWFEAIAPERIYPQDIHRAQLHRRLAAARDGRDAWWAPEYVELPWFDRNFVAGRDILRAGITAVNDTAVSRAYTVELNLRQADRPEGRVLSIGELDFGELDGVSAKTLEYAYALPGGLRTGWYLFDALLRRGGRLLAGTTREIYVVHEEDMRYSAGRHGKTALYEKRSADDGVSGTAAALDAMGLSYDRLDDFARLDSYEVLILGAYSVDGTVKEAGGRIRAWIEAGGRMLSFEQDSRDEILRNTFASGIPWLPGKRLVYAGLFRYAEMTLPDHPIFDGLEQRNFDSWNGNDGVLFEGLMGPTGPSPRPVTGAASYFGAPHPVDVRARSVVLDLALGDGVLLMSQLKLTGRYGDDPAATRVADNLVRHILSGDRTHSSEMK